MRSFVQDRSFRPGHGLEAPRAHHMPWIFDSLPVLQVRALLRIIDVKPLRPWPAIHA